MAAKASAPAAKSTRSGARHPARPAIPAAPAARDARPPAIISIEGGEPEGEAERVPLFAIGDEVYTMLAEPPLSLAMEAMDVLYRRGEAFAAVFAMRAMLGPEGYRALLGSKRVTKKQYMEIGDRVSSVLFGMLEPEEDEDPNR